MRRGVTLALIVFVSNVMAIVLAPPDPITECMHTCGILCVAIPCYLVGLRQGRKLAETKGTAVANKGEERLSPPAA